MLVRNFPAEGSMLVRTVTHPRHSTGSRVRNDLRDGEDGVRNSEVLLSLARAG
jgi:hypothetical protein